MNARKVIALLDELQSLKARRDEAWGRVFAETGDRTALVDVAQELSSDEADLMARIGRATH